MPPCLRASPIAPERQTKTRRIDGAITVEEAKSAETSLDVVEGMQFDRGYLSPYFVTDPEKNGYNAATAQYGDLLAAGVIDPVKVVRSALQNAACRQPHADDRSAHRRQAEAGKGGRQRRAAARWRRLTDNCEMSRRAAHSGGRRSPGSS